MTMAEMIRAMRDSGVPEDMVQLVCAELRNRSRRDAIGKSPADRVARYRKRRICSEGEWRAIRRAVFGNRDHVCAYCGQREGRLVVDHIIPVAKGGTDDFSNLAIACHRCNASKRDRLIGEWRPDWQ